MNLLGLFENCIHCQIYAATAVLLAFIAYIFFYKWRKSSKSMKGGRYFFLYFLVTVFFSSAFVYVAVQSLRFESYAAIKKAPE